MKNIFLLLIIVVVFFTPLNAQNQLTISVGPGLYVYNSENNLPIMGSKSHLFYINYGLQFSTTHFLGKKIGLEFNYNNSFKEKTYKMYFTDENGVVVPGDFGSDVTLVNYCFDFSYYQELNNFFSYAIGPTLLLTNRTVEVDPFLYDRLATYAIGVNGFIEFYYNINDEGPLFFVSKFKFRFTHSVWHDAGIRDLSDYAQSFLSTELSFGFGYNFNWL